jgi:hypothetical protein
VPLQAETDKITLLAEDLQKCRSDRNAGLAEDRQRDRGRPKPTEKTGLAED